MLDPVVRTAPSERRPVPLDVQVAAIAVRQHGLITIVQLRSLGFGDSAVCKRVARGVLHRVGRGVYAVGHGSLTREGRWLAGVLCGGVGAVLSHLSAASLWEVSRFRERRVDVVSAHRRRPRHDMAFHHTCGLTARDVTTHRRIPVTSMARTLVDLTDVLTPHQLANVIHEAAFRGRFVEPAARDAMERANGRHKLAVLERAIALYRGGSAGTRSGAEDAFLALVRDEEPLVNTGCSASRSTFTGRVDGWPSRWTAQVTGAHRRRTTTAVAMRPSRRPATSCCASPTETCRSGLGRWLGPYVNKGCAATLNGVNSGKCPIPPCQRPQ